jgi:hypothetical protein
LAFRPRKSCVARTTPLTASFGVPAVELAVTTNAPVAAALAESFTITFIAKL